MEVSQAEQLRKAIECLVDAKLLDAMSKPGGMDRLLAYRATGVAPFGVRQAQRKLQDLLEHLDSGAEHEHAYVRQSA